MATHEGISTAATLGEGGGRRAREGGRGCVGGGRRRDDGGFGGGETGQGGRRRSNNGRKGGVGGGGRRRRRGGGGLGEVGGGGAELVSGGGETHVCERLALNSINPYVSNGCGERRDRREGGGAELVSGGGETHSCERLAPNSINPNVSNGCGERRDRREGGGGVGVGGRGEGDLVSGGGETQLEGRLSLNSNNSQNVSRGREERGDRREELGGGGGDGGYVGGRGEGGLVSVGEKQLGERLALKSNSPNVSRGGEGRGVRGGVEGGGGRGVRGGGRGGGGVGGRGVGGVRDIGGGGRGLVERESQRQEKRQTHHSNSQTVLVERLRTEEGRGRGGEGGGVEGGGGDRSEGGLVARGEQGRLQHGDERRRTRHHSYDNNNNNSQRRNVLTLVSEKKTNQGLSGAKLRLLLVSLLRGLLLLLVSPLQLQQSHHHDQQQRRRGLNLLPAVRLNPVRRFNHLPLPAVGLALLTLLATTASVTASELRITTPPRSTTVLYGNRLKMHCRATGGNHQPIRIKWFKDGEAMVKVRENYRVSVRLGTLRFSHVRVTDRGEYQCRASNGFDVVMSDPALLDVHAKAEFVRAPQPRMICSFSEMTSVTCFVGGRPLPSIQWRIDGVSITEPNSGMYGVVSIVEKVDGGWTLKSTMHVNSTTSAQLECEAVNEHVEGVTVVSAKIDLIVKPPAGGVTYGRDESFPLINLDQRKRKHVPERGIPEIVQQLLKGDSQCYTNTRQSSWQASATVVKATDAELIPDDQFVVSTNQGLWSRVEEEVTKEFVQKFLPDLESTGQSLPGLADWTEPPVLTSAGAHSIHTRHYEEAVTFLEAAIRLSPETSDNATWYVNLSTRNYEGEMLSALMHVFRALAHTVSRLHAQGWIFCDLRANNVLLTRRTGQVILARIGRMVKLPSGVPSVSCCPADGQRKNHRDSTRWSAPEVLHSHMVSPASDVFSLGTMLWEVLNARNKCHRDPAAEGNPPCLVPFADVKSSDIAKMVQEGVLLPCIPHCPQWLYKLICDCRNPDSQARPSSSQVQEILLQHCQGTYENVAHLFRGAPSQAAPDVAHYDEVGPRTPSRSFFQRTLGKMRKRPEKRGNEGFYSLGYPPVLGRDSSERDDRDYQNAYSSRPSSGKSSSAATPPQPSPSAAAGAPAQTGFPSEDVIYTDRDGSERSARGRERKKPASDRSLPFLRPPMPLPPSETPWVKENASLVDEIYESCGEENYENLPDTDTPFCPPHPTDEINEDYKEENYENLPDTGVSDTPFLSPCPTDETNEDCKEENYENHPDTGVSDTPFLSPRPTDETNEDCKEENYENHPDTGVSDNPFCSPRPADETNEDYEEVNDEIIPDTGVSDTPFSSPDLYHDSVHQPHPSIATTHHVRAHNRDFIGRAGLSSDASSDINIQLGHRSVRQMVGLFSNHTTQLGKDEDNSKQLNKATGPMPHTPASPVQAATGLIRGDGGDPDPPYVAHPPISLPRQTLGHPGAQGPDCTYVAHPRAQGSDHAHRISDPRLKPGQRDSQHDNPGEQGFGSH